MGGITGVEYLRVSPHIGLAARTAKGKLLTRQRDLFGRLSIQKGKGWVDGRGWGLQVVFDPRLWEKSALFRFIAHNRHGDTCTPETLTSSDVGGIIHHKA